MVTTPPVDSPHVNPDRPIPIALMNLGGLLPIDLNRLAQDLNRARGQKLFEFHAVKMPVPLPGRDLPHAYSFASLFRTIKGNLFAHSFGIGITHEVLEDSRFNWHDENLGVGAITIDHAEVYNPPGRSLYQYVAYLVLCEALCITSKTQLEHTDRYFCLFDMCTDREDIKTCIKEAHIHEGCKRRLVSLGFTPHDLASADDILRFVKQISISHAVRETIENPFVGFLLGGLTVNLVSNYVSAMDDLIRGAITLFMIIGIGVAFYHNYRRTR